MAQGCPGLTVVPAGGEAAALAPLPIALLDLPEDERQLFARWGLRTIGDLARLPPAALAARLGAGGPRLVELARGEDAGVFRRAPLPERFETTLELDWPVEGLEPLAFLLQRALEPLGEALAARGAKAAALAFELGLADGTTHARTLRPAAASGDARTWRTLVLLDLEAHPPRDAIARLTLRAEPTPARASQFSLLDPAQPAPEKLAETLARLHAWTEQGRSGSPQLVDTHRPGAFAVSTFAPGPLPRGRPARAPCRAAGGAARLPPAAARARPHEGGRSELRGGAGAARSGHRRGRPLARLGRLVGRVVLARGVGRGARDAAGTVPRRARPSACFSTACAASGSSKASSTSRRS